MIKYNFRKASATPTEIADRIAAMQSDFDSILSQKNGFSKFRADLDFQGEVAALFRETVIDQFSEWDPTPIFTERRDARLGDKVEFTQLHKNGRVVKYAPNSHPVIFTPRKSRYSVGTSQYEMAVGISLYKIAQRTMTLDDVVSVEAEKLKDHYVRLVLEAVNVACGTGQNDQKGRALRTTVANGSSLTQAQLDAAIRRMGPGSTIFGNSYALNPVMKFAAAVSPGLAEEFNQRGLMGVYAGCKIVAIEPSHFVPLSGGFEPLINGTDLDNLIFIASPQPGATLLERDLSAMNWEDLNVERQEFRTGIRFDHGIFVHTPSRYHVIEQL